MTQAGLGIDVFVVAGEKRESAADQGYA